MLEENHSSINLVCRSCENQIYLFVAPSIFQNNIFFEIIFICCMQEHNVCTPSPCFFFLFTHINSLFNALRHRVYIQYCLPTFLNLNGVSVFKKKNMFDLYLKLKTCLRFESKNLFKEAELI